MPAFFSSLLRFTKRFGPIGLIGTLIPFNVSLCEDKKKDFDWSAKIVDFVGKENAEKVKKLLGFEKDADIGKELDRILHSDNSSQYGYGFVMGYLSGFTLKKVSRVVAFIFGGVFVGIQVLSYSGYVTVNYEKLQKDTEELLDQNGKNGMKLDENALAAIRDKLVGVVGYNMPSGSCFTVGLLLGLRS